MGVFARLLRRSSSTPRRKAPDAAAAPDAGAAEEQNGQEDAATAISPGGDPEDVGIPKQQSADEAADSEAADSRP